MVNAIDVYIQNVISLIHTSPQERGRIEADLRAHLLEAQESGDSIQAVLARMGTPAEVAAEFISQVGLRYASYWRRAAAFLIDAALIFVMMGPLSALAVSLSNLVPQGARGPEQWLAGLLITLTILTGVMAGGMIVLYFPILEGRFGQTVGKAALRLRVVREDGLPIGYKEAILRRLSFYFEFFALDAVFPLFNKKRQRAMDIVAHTVVIEDSPR